MDARCFPYFQGQALWQEPDNQQEGNTAAVALRLHD